MKNKVPMYTLQMFIYCCIPFASGTFFIFNPLNCTGVVPSPSVDDAFLGFSFDGDVELRDAD